MMWSLLWNVQRRELNFTWNEDSEENRPSEWHLGLYKAYNSVEKHMKLRKILSDETGVLYSDGSKQVLWSFVPLRLRLDSVSDVESCCPATFARPMCWKRASMESISFNEGRA